MNYFLIRAVREVKLIARVWMARAMILLFIILGAYELLTLNLSNMKYTETTIVDTIVYTVMFSLIVFIVWLSNYEMDMSLKKSRESEELLKSERDSLEERMSVRTQELIRNQEKISLQTEHSIRIGELAQGIIHDIMSPLSSITLYIDQLSNKQRTQVKGDEERMLVTVVNASNRMKTFMHSVRHMIDINSLHEHMTTNIHDEIYMAYDVLAYKARLNEIEIKIDTLDNIIVPGNPLRMYQVFLNLLNNAIESFSQNNCGKTPKRISVTTKVHVSSIKIHISDNGCGIDPDNLQNIFYHAYTTKIAGTGIGLGHVYSIITNEFGGNIQVKSSIGNGTSFTISLPF